jgi:hypothetical protein
MIVTMFRVNPYPFPMTHQGEMRQYHRERHTKSVRSLVARNPLFWHVDPSPWGTPYNLLLERVALNLVRERFLTVQRVPLWLSPLPAGTAA